MTTAAGITMIVLGALGAVFGLLLLLGGVFISGAGSTFDNQAPELSGLSGAVGGVLIVLALIVVAIGILDIVAGGYVLAGRAWARITGIVVSAILAVFWALGSLGGGNRGGGIFLSLILLAANLFVIWALATTGSWFAARRT
jgi:hypothetical protein